MNATNSRFVAFFMRQRRKPQTVRELGRLIELLSQANPFDATSGSTVATSGETRSTTESTRGAGMGMARF